MPQSQKVIALKDACCQIPKLLKGVCNPTCLFKDPSLKTIKCKIVAHSAPCAAPPCNPLKGIPCECYFTPNAYNKIQLEMS